MERSGFEKSRYLQPNGNPAGWETGWFRKIVRKANVIMETDERALYLLFYYILKRTLILKKFGRVSKYLFESSLSRIYGHDPRRLFTHETWDETSNPFRHTATWHPKQILTHGAFDSTSRPNWQNLDWHILSYSRRSGYFTDRNYFYGRKREESEGWEKERNNKKKTLWRDSMLILCWR